MSVAKNTPILIGVGQSIKSWRDDAAENAPSPLTLSADATRNAMADTGAPDRVRDAIDTVAFVRLNCDSVAGAPAPCGRIENLPEAVADAVGLSPTRRIYSGVGGDQPQVLVNEFAEELYQGTVKAVLLTGAEAISAEKHARKRRIALDWSAPSNTEMEDRGLGDEILTKDEIKDGLGFPVQTYPVFENALRARLGLSREQYLKRISEIFEPFSKVASNNPYAQFPVSRDAAFLSTESKENYRVTDCYLKWHVAQDNVNQGAALIMTTVETAKELGISEDRWVYLHGYAKAQDLNVTERPDLSRSKSIELTIDRALSESGLSVNDLSHYDLYSCFPCVVQIAAECLSLDPLQDSLTVTGGLPFFGGAGNNYSMHAIASMAERLRENPGQSGLVLANGGMMSKHAVGIYSTTPKADWSPISSADLADLNEQIEQSRTSKADGISRDATIETFSISYGRFAPERGVVIASSSSGRIMKRFHSNHRATMNAVLDRPEPIGSPISFHQSRGKSYVSPAGPIGSEADDRNFNFVSLNRDGHVLEVTINRPKAYNALSGPAHFELSEVFDEFERDQDLWVAIITGAGDKAFCSGNDLKATAKGGDISIPRSGFAGLCNRLNREKPVIAAVNGVAMGGGLEIVLASDLAIIDPAAKCALPEVRVGLFAAAGGLQRLTRQIGQKAAMELILTGKQISADEALRLGIVNTISAPGRALKEARELADSILGSSPTAVRASKSVLNDFDTLDYELETSLQTAGKTFAKLMRTNDFKEGVTAFSEKRAPNWTNS